MTCQEGLCRVDPLQHLLPLRFVDALDGEVHDGLLLATLVHVGVFPLDQLVRNAEHDQEVGFKIRAEGVNAYAKDSMLVRKQNKLVAHRRFGLL